MRPHFHFPHCFPRELEDLVSAYAPWLGDEVPTFAAAFAWPYGNMDGAGDGGVLAVREVTATATICM